MSWTLVALRAPRGAGRPEEIPDDSPPILPRAELVRRLREVVPDAEWLDEGTGVVRRSRGTLEIAVDGGDPVKYVFLEMRRDAADVESVVDQILEVLDLRAVGEDGEFYEPGLTLA